MKVQILSLAFLTFVSVGALANKDKTASSAKAYKVAQSLYKAGVQISDEGEEGALYHAWAIDCDYQNAEGVRVFETCDIYSGPNENAPVYKLKEIQADALIKALVAANATEKFEDGKFSLNISNLDAYTSINGSKFYRLEYVDLNN